MVIIYIFKLSVNVQKSFANKNFFANKKIILLLQRRNGRVVECGGLENR